MSRPGHPFGFGGASITQECFDFIREALPEGKTILELGSGFGTGELAKHYKMISVENDKEWIGRYDSFYIRAPIKRYGKGFSAPDIPNNHGWYDPEILEDQLQGIDSYHLILVDGPHGKHGRGGFLSFLNLFDTNVPIIIDDARRKPERMLMEKVAQKLGREHMMLEDGRAGYIPLGDG